MTRARKSSVWLIVLGLVLLITSLANGILLLATSDQSRRDSRIIDLAGLARGSVQRAVAIELGGQDDDRAIIEADRYLGELLLVADGPAADGKTPLGAASEFKKAWDRLKAELREGSSAPGNEGPQGVAAARRAAVLRMAEDCWNVAGIADIGEERLAELRSERYDGMVWILGLDIALALLVLLVAKRYVRDELEFLASYDPLTSAMNRSSFHLVAGRLYWDSVRNGLPLCLVEMDIDHFKRVNDDFGHAAGDAVLREFAALVQGTVRRSDVFARIGGEEFALAVADATLDEAAALAEKVRAAVAERDFPAAGTVTASFGVALLGDGESLEGLLARADRALYRAKAGGRNRVERDPPGAGH